MTYESCESKVANLLATLPSLSASEVVKVLEECIGLQDKEMHEVKQRSAVQDQEFAALERECWELKKKLAETPKIMVYDECRKLGEAKELQLHFEGKKQIWFRAKIAGPNGTADHVDTPYLKGEI